MRFPVILFSLLAFVSGFVSVSAEAQYRYGFGRDYREDHYRPRREEDQPRILTRVCFFQHANFRGRSFCVPRNTQIENLVNTQFQDSISSIWVEGRTTVTYCRDSRMRNCRVSSGSIANLADQGFNDKISSIRVE